MARRAGVRVVAASAAAATARTTLGPELWKTAKRAK